jgi:flagellar protein FlgJ
MAIAPTNTSFYADPSSLGGLKRDAATQSPEAIREVARQFESLFTSMMLKSMRSASMGDELFGSDQGDMYQDMFDQQMAVQLASGKGVGLADMLVRQLMQGGAAVAAPPTAAAEVPATHEDFVSALRPAATAAARELGVDPDTIIAHAALETGWGRSMPAAANGQSSFNLFGIKAGGSWSGSAVASRTREFTAGRMSEVSAGFRSYDSPDQAMQDYVRLLKDNPRYAGALGTGSDVQAFARALQRGGYATDPDYAAKLTAVAATLKSGKVLPLNTTHAV